MRPMRPAPQGCHAEHALRACSSCDASDDAAAVPLRWRAAAALAGSAVGPATVLRQPPCIRPLLVATRSIGDAEIGSRQRRQGCHAAPMYVKERLAIGLDAADRRGEQVRQRARQSAHRRPSRPPSPPSPHSSNACVAKRAAAFMSCRLATSAPFPVCARSHRSRSLVARILVRGRLVEQHQRRVLRERVAIATRCRSPRDSDAHRGRKRWHSRAAAASSRSARRATILVSKHIARGQHRVEHRARERVDPAVGQQRAKPASSSARSAVGAAAEQRPRRPRAADAGDRGEQRRFAGAVGPEARPALTGPHGRSSARSQAPRALSVDPPAPAGAARCSSPHQQPEKQRHAEQRGEHADRQLQTARRRCARPCRP